MDSLEELKKETSTALRLQFISVALAAASVLLALWRGGAGARSTDGASVLAVAIVVPLLAYSIKKTFDASRRTEQLQGLRT